MRRAAGSLLVCLLSGVSPGLVYGQNLSDLPTTVFREIVAAPTPGGTGVVAHTSAWEQDQTVTNVTELISRIAAQVGTQISLFPIGSSSGGFTYRYDSTLGTYSRTTQTFGPAFAERAEPIGRGRFAFGMNYLHSSYRSLDGKDLEDGEIQFILLHQPGAVPPAQAFVEGDVIEAPLEMKMSSDTIVWYGNYGVTDRLDLGISVPLVHMTMDVVYPATIRDYATRVVSPTTHLFANGTKTASFDGSGSATGIGDILLHAKYGIPTAGKMHVAAALDVRVPSGDSDNMLGSGGTLTQLSFIASSIGSRVSPHANFGYTFASGTDTVKDQINYVAGVEYMASSKVTVLGDILGRTVRNSDRLEDLATPHTFRQGATAPLETVTLNTVQLVTGTINTVWGAVGVKFTPWRNLLISANVLIPFTDAGLKSRVTPTVGFEFAF